MITARLLKQCVPVAALATTLGLIGVSSGQPAASEPAASEPAPEPAASAAARKGREITFRMVPSAAAATCLAKARAHVRIQSLGSVEKMRVDIEGLPPNTEFDFFVLQEPKAPFGMSWYQGDIKTNAYGRGRGEFIGRFNTETFIVAPGASSAPIVHDKKPFPDAKENPATAPVHTFHLGLWFNSPRDAAKAGCPSTVTPFNGDHDAGIQVLNTSNFSDDRGPLRQLEPRD